jgi:hypothetical protein
MDYENHAKAGLQTIADTSSSCELKWAWIQSGIPKIGESTVLSLGKSISGGLSVTARRSLT